ncbi:MAG: diguanylate cyclase [Desulfarculus sp.]|nr:diguanylate cyclase [Pseudomonadota bacterium]MBV1715261.1 diguanylate cyclase [Desulfarculus sp.]MBU4574083.1 diguanylate cyclase [Pseudomonadota bacterium]MBU4597916.1 diguanylate cyclase [Pseudomonadota bacterium]MBV1737915.1 diguanylate cyclase [Desulfarculus sp.]
MQSKIKLGIFFWVLLSAWTAAVGGSLFWHLHQTSALLVDAARIQARTAFEKDVLYRRWNTQRGGVYARLSERTPANPYLKVPHRDIPIPGGGMLTMVNPAYMTRQAHELGTLSTGVLGHITSLRPLRPENRPDQWEARTLGRIEGGAKEVSGTVELGGQQYLRLMKPLFVEQGCLACHAKQGYKLGDVRGGICISVPMAPLRSRAQESRLLLVLTHLALWLLGAGGLVFLVHTLNSRLNERHRTALTLYRLATTDPLTGAYNRGNLMDRGAEEFARYKRYQIPFSALMIDIDHFKKVNDTYGHHVGDEVLKRMVARISANLRQTDIFGRYGGEEFVAFLTHTESAGALNAAEQLRVMLSELTMETEKGSFNFTVSIGVSQVKSEDQTLEDVIKRADEALYMAKEGGRNRVVSDG